LTSVLLADRREWSASLLCALPAGERDPMGLESGGAPESVWTLWRRDKSLAPAGNRTLAVGPVAGRYAD
jgi:hypothetical protein